RPPDPAPAARTARGAAGLGGRGNGGYGYYGETQPGPRRRDPAERGLRGLVAAGPSQVGVTGAMRARDAARPQPEDLAAAEQDLVTLRRPHAPPDSPPPPCPTHDPPPP